METTFIYALIDPRNFEVRYIGKSDDPALRLRSHVYTSKEKKKNIHKANWIKQLLSFGLFPILQIIEECDESIWEEREKYWISFYKKNMKNNLVNITEGGEGGATFKGKFHSQEAKKKIGIASLGRNLGRVAWNRGILCSQENIKKLSESHKGQVSWMKGKKHSEKTKRLISLNSRHYQTEETKKKISDHSAMRGTHPVSPMKGKHHSEKTIAKMRESALKRTKCRPTGALWLPGRP